MNDVTYTWPAGPAAPPQGLDRAFRSALRRRMGTAAATAALPVVLAAGLLGGVAGPTADRAPDRLDVTSEGGRSAVRPGAGGGAAAPGTAPSSRGPAPAPGQAPGPDNGRTGARPAGVPPTSLPTPLPPSGPHRQEAWTVTAASTSSVHVDVTERTYLHLDQLAFTGSPSYVGVYLVSDDGARAGGALHTAATRPAPPGTPPGLAPTYLTSLGKLSRLEPGGYTLYVATDRPTTVTIPVPPEQPGRALTTTTPATSRFGHDTRTIGFGGSAADLRLAFTAGARSLAAGVGHLSSDAANAGAMVTTCLAAAGGDCESEARTGSNTLGVTSTVGSSVVAPPGTYADGSHREVLVSGDPGTATDARLTVWSFVLDL